jgi:hypothetical protein
MTKVLMLSRQRDVRMMQMLCFALGARSSGPAFEQLVDMLYEARRGSEEIVAKFVAEVDELKRELAEERAKRARCSASGSPSAPACSDLPKPTAQIRSRRPASAPPANPQSSP